MTTTTRARQFAFAAAERRVMENLKDTVPVSSQARRVAIVAGSALLFAVTFAVRLAINDPSALIANFYVVPITLLAIEFGAEAGVVAAALALGLVVAWSAVDQVHLGVLGYTSRGAVLIVTGALVGRFSERLRGDIAERRRVQRHLSLYADQLERANQHLAESVERLEAFAEIARTVGGETDLERVLALIMAKGREIVAARRLLVCLPEGEHLVAVTGLASSHQSPMRLPLHGSLAGEVLLSRRPRRVAVDDHPRQLHQLAAGARAAILVPLIFRGEVLGVLAGIDRQDRRNFEEEDEQLLLSVAASAATAVATARSVAAARLRLSLEAAEQARGRWARELHDETLQGLTGVRMVLSAGLAREDGAGLQLAAQTADAHLGEEMRNLRDLIAELRPAALDDLGLGPALGSLAKRQAMIGRFTVDVKLVLDPRHRLGGETEIAIYRIVQEGLSNVVKHADAREVQLRVRQGETSVTVSVEDDGRGFRPDTSPGGFGLTGMRERASLAGGRLSVSSENGGPTCVTAVLPSPTRPSGERIA